MVLLFCYLGLIHTPWLMNKLGLFDYGRWFLDSYAILATNDAVARGLDPALPNPLDDLHRPHSYSSWWLGLRHLGLGREDNFLIGSATVAGFLIAAALLLRPQNKREAGFGAALLVAPPVLLALLRANNDLVVFAVLAGGLLALRVSPTVGTWSLVGAVTLATGLKFYPLLGAVALLALPAPQRWWGVMLAAVASGLVFASEWDWFRRAVFPIPDAVYLFGAPVWWREFGVGAPLAIMASLVGVALPAGLAVRRGWTIGLAQTDDRIFERASFALGAVLLLGCWLAGISFAYRWVFAIMLLPWLWYQQSNSRVARVALALVLINMWSDGLFCLATNVGIGPMPEPELRFIQHWWLVLSQPPVWALMALLAGWLADLGWQRWREVFAHLIARWPRPPVLVFGLAVCAGWLGLTLSDRARTMQGVSDYGMWFLDSYAVLAASDAHRAGLDTTNGNAFDPLNRPHRYSDWWHALGVLGLDRKDNFAVGVIWCGLFALAVAATARCRDWGEALWLGAVLLSPSVWQGLLRANNDLVIFAVLAVAVLTLRRPDARWWWLAPLAVALAAGLKFYPAAAVTALAVLLPSRHGGVKLAAGIVACLLALWAVATQWERGVFPIDVSVHVWGGRILLDDLGIKVGGLVLAGVFALGVSLAAFFLRSGTATKSSEDTADTAAFLLSASVLSGCFIAGLNYGYRWIFALWLGPWLWAMIKTGGSAWPRLLWLAIPLLLWADGLFCVAVNAGILSVAPADLPRAQHLWRLVTQPLHWLIMVGLAGYTVRLLLETLRQARMKASIMA